MNLGSFQEDNMSKQISLSNSSIPIEIDDWNYCRVLRRNWFLVLDENRNPKSIQSNGRFNNKIILPRFLLNLTKADKVDVDHWNHNIFDNKESNFRISNRSQNSCNQSLKSSNKSGYKGVSWNKRIGKWHSQIKHKYKAIHLGYFDDIILAAIAYDNAAIELHGDFAYLNFPLYGY